MSITPCVEIELSLRASMIICELTGAMLAEAN